MRYPPPDPLHLFSSKGAHDAPSLIAVARQIAASRAPHSAPASQSSSSFVALRPSQAGSTTDIADCAALRSRRPSPSPTRTHSSRSSSRAEPAGVILQMLVRFADQLATQSAAQSVAQLAALTSVKPRFETLHSATPPRRSRHFARQAIIASRSPSRRASPSPQTLSPSPERAGCRRSSRCDPSFFYAPARSRPSRYGAPAGALCVCCVSCAAGCGSAVAPAGPSPTRSFRVAYIARVARNARVCIAYNVDKFDGEPTVGAPARAARSPRAACYVVFFAYTVRSTVFADCTAR